MAAAIVTGVLIEQAPVAPPAPLPTHALEWWQSNPPAKIIWAGEERLATVPTPRLFTFTVEESVDYLRWTVRTQFSAMVTNSINLRLPLYAEGVQRGFRVARRVP